MSLDALRWAFVCEVGSSAERLVLLALANDCRRGAALAFPSRERMHAVTRLDPKTITAALKKLEGRRLICPTGAKKGRTGRIPVYRLAVAGERAPVNDSENGSIRQRRESGKSGGIEQGAMAPLFPSNGTEIPSSNATENGGQNQEVVLEPGMSQAAKAGADAPMPAKDYLFGPAREALVAQGVSFKDAGSLLGKARSVHGDDEAARAIRRFIAEGTIDLRSRVAALGRYRRAMRGAPDRNLGSVDYDAGLPARERVAA